VGRPSEAIAEVLGQRSRATSGVQKLAYDAPEMNATLRQAIFDLGPQIRYVAFGEGQRVETAQRDGIADASDASSDFFEELLVNPTLLTLARQRGELDCGGLRHVIVAYGNFNQVVVPAAWGHVSVCVEREADAEVVARQVALLIEQTQ
jgi:hypothetical protein